MKKKKRDSDHRRYSEKKKKKHDSDHRMVKSELKVHLRRERKQLPILPNMMSRATDIKLNIQNIHSLLKGEYVNKTVQ